MFFTKSSFIKKSVKQSKNKECKKRYHKKKSTMKVFQVYISIVYNSFILELSISISIALLLWRQRKIRTTFKTLVLKKTTIWRLKKSHSSVKL